MRMKRLNQRLAAAKAATLCGLLLTSACTTTQPSSTDPRIAQVQNNLLPAFVTPQTQPMQMADRMRHYGVPGISVAVVQNGQLLWSHAWGVADVATGRPLTPSTPMQAASISKAVAAVGALRLVQDQRLVLDQDVATQLRSWQLPPGEQSAEHPVTLRRLLSHGAGLGVSGFAGYVPGAPVPTTLQVLDGLAPANSAAVRVQHRPGSRWEYSGGGYVVLQQLMEDMTGEPFAAWMQREVLARAGMASSSFVAPQGPALATVAVGHQKKLPIANSETSSTSAATPTPVPITGQHRLHPELAAAGLWTTPSDLARLTLALQRSASPQGPAPQLLQAATMAQALQPQQGTSGLGFVLQGTPVVDNTGAGPGQRFGHDGSNQGFESRWLADRQRGVVVMTNSNGAMPLMIEVIYAIAQVHGWADWQALNPAGLQERLQANPVFLRGSMNQWGLSAPLRRTGALTYTADLALPAGRTEYKVAAADWAAVDLGQAQAAAAPGMAAAQHTTSLVPAGPNLVLMVDRPGRYRFELDATGENGPVVRVRPLD